ncbi:MAG: transcriptional regulator GcvA [Minwuiales bacterium]|nr:transcriptional regulator GcvA [Minwuiales bacterium]
MADRLPSLKALRAFEAVARHLSLTAAAAELHVTPAAISHQVKALEADLGVTLLRRVGNQFRLTEVALDALPALQAGFDSLTEAVRRLRADESRWFLTISVGPTFASNWLVRRLGRFKVMYPDIEVRLDTSDLLADFVRDGVDVAIRFGSGEYPGARSHRLFDEEIYPVCSPELLETGPPLTQPDDLANYTLLHATWTRDSEDTIDWEMWLRAAGAANVDASRGPRFGHANIALQAAAQGAGFALASNSLAGDDLAAGRLVCPFDIVLPLNFAYYLVYPEATAETPKIAAFHDWLMSEIGGNA